MCVCDLQDLAAKDQGQERCENLKTDTIPSFSELLLPVAHQ